jgi:hypothetical protein
MSVAAQEQSARVEGRLVRRALTPRLDTLVFVPEQGLFYLLWRAVFPIMRPESIVDIEELRIEYERLPLGAGR